MPLDQLCCSLAWGAVQDALFWRDLETRKERTLKTYRVLLSGWTSCFIDWKSTCPLVQRPSLKTWCQGGWGPLASFNRMTPCPNEGVNTSSSLSDRDFYFIGKPLTSDAAWGECCKEKSAYSCSEAKFWSLVRYDYFGIKYWEEH